MLTRPGPVVGRPGTWRHSSHAAITHAAEPAVDALPKTLSTALRDASEGIADPIVEFTAQDLGKHPAKHI